MAKKAGRLHFANRLSATERLMSETNPTEDLEPEEPGGSDAGASLQILQYIMIFTMLSGIGIAGMAGAELGSTGLAIAGGVLAAFSGLFYVYLTLRG
jgi:hypothetical protein